MAWRSAFSYGLILDLQWIDTSQATESKVEAGLARDGGVSVVEVLSDTLLSRASQLPHF
jgi:hypothetical protein